MPVYKYGVQIHPRTLDVQLDKIFTAAKPTPGLDHLRKEIKRLRRAVKKLRNSMELQADQLQDLTVALGEEIEDAS